MTLTQAVAAAVVLALLGGLHCVGMCGPIALIAAKGTLRRLPYLAGKALAYAVLGLAAGAAGGLVTSVVPFQRALSFVAGAALLATGILWLATNGNLKVPGRVGAILSGALGRALSAAGGGRRSPFVVGVANGFLPCGLVYGALAIALATSDPIGGALSMVAFGVATGPALLLAAYVGDRLAPAVRGRWQIAAGVALVAFGLLTIWRRFASVGHMAH